MIERSVNWTFTIDTSLNKASRDGLELIANVTLMVEQIVQGQIATKKGSPNLTLSLSTLAIWLR